MSNISECLPGHSAAVTCVRFMSNERLMTGDEQGMLFLWRMERAKVCALHHLSDMLSHRSKHTVDTCLQSSSSWESFDLTFYPWWYSCLWIFRFRCQSLGSDYLWLVKIRIQIQGTPWPAYWIDELNEKQTISMGKRYPLSLALAYLPGTQGNRF